MTIETVIFDLDGTVTEPILDFTRIRADIGLVSADGPILEAMEKMTPDQRLNAIEILDRHEAEAVNNSTLNEGAEEVFTELYQKSINIGILTRNTSENAIAIGKIHNLHFDAVIGRDDALPKPDPDGVLKLCNQFNTTPANSIVVGDYLYDLLCAKAAGAKSVLLKNHPKADDFAEHADYTITSLTQLMPIIKDGHEKLKSIGGNFQ